MENSSKKIATAFGVYLGISLVLITVLAYVFSLALLTKWWFGVMMLIFIITMSSFAVSKAKKASSTLFGFKSAFGVYFLTVFIGSFISLLFSIILFNFIDPDAAQEITRLTMESARKMMEGFGAPESEINKQMLAMQENSNYGIGNQLKGYAYQLAFFAVIGLIVALIFREKEKTNL
ncbi:DUF4199 domain-containing protein [Christiangramia fulva]|uniref:DUF4199 domain-containing protein n=1 Tax=Christiangramia fulva TaxID=2126553 RepID=A0A2R3Z8U7_9FLAO|nr:DUF4199 domain-containing protein [Christiangramia fulva]AVR46680.1 DUF4199 domain-containing protein [Christiangramia fulva]